MSPVLRGGNADAQSRARDQSENNHGRTIEKININEKIEKSKTVDNLNWFSSTSFA